MNILLTNDDGYQAKGINYLFNYFKEKGHTVVMIAPDSQKSGFSHAITLTDTVRVTIDKEDLKVLKGTPADCVNFGFLGISPVKIDAVVSGVNHGPNLGSDIIFSGTAAGARQGAFHGVPSFALSVDTWDNDPIVEQVGEFLDKYFINLYGSFCSGTFFNINFPNLPPESICGVRKTVPCPKRHYIDNLISFDSPTQGKYLWIEGKSPEMPVDPGTDAYAVRQNEISVSCVKAYPESHNTDFKL